MKVAHTRYERAQQRALYLVPEGAPTLRLTRDGLRLPGAGGAVTREGFESVIAALRERAPDARHDERLASAPRRRSSYASVFDEGERRGAITSNVAETDLAVSLLARALAERQLV